MRERIATAVVALVICMAAVRSDSRAQAPDPFPLLPIKPLSGSVFQSAETRALQADDGANPAMLWVEDGQRLWSVAPSAGGQACAACHGEAATSMRGVAASFPKIDGKTGALFNLEARISACRTEHQHASAWAYESQPLLAMTAYLTFLSRGLPRQVAIDGAARPYFEKGRAFFMARQGQLNLACAQCHDDKVGQKLRGDTISQGQSTGWPGYRLEWQTMGSLHRRLRACSLGVRAQILDFGSPDYVALELYLAARSKGLPLESPSVRR